MDFDDGFFVEVEVSCSVDIEPWTLLGRRRGADFVFLSARFPKHA